MSLAETYPDVFFRVGALSSTFGWGAIGANNPTLLSIIRQSSFKNLVMYIDSGSPKDSHQVTRLMRDHLLNKGYLPTRNLQHWTRRGAEHDEKAWRDRLTRPLQFLLAWP